MLNTDLQKALTSVGYYKGAIDGDIGTQSKAAITDFLKVNSVNYKGWNLDRCIIAAKQLVCKQAGIQVGNIDGLVGPSTRYAFEVFDARKAGVTNAESWRDKDFSSANASLVHNSTPWPRQAQVPDFYGAVGKNQTMVELPFKMRLAWNKNSIVTRISLHQKVADSALRVFNRIANEYTEAQRREIGLDLYGGSLNVRKMRGGSNYSMHSWGIAIDFDPERNQLTWGKDRARLAQPDCEKFWKFWEDEGWLSLGRARNYDFMHVQAARL